MDGKQLKTLAELDQAQEMVVTSMPPYRGRMFAAYMENGFTREEAFELVADEMRSQIWAQHGDEEECDGA